ncbi:carboxypeptidase regulatory-like domain-containing protein [candidate division KSB1 bacterium]|nr:carboxypeptidase regulatory-like domain-containing protein [candidate division KSB1 bacterium]
MQAKNNRYWLAAVVLFSLLLAPTVFASSQSALHFEQKMDLALKMWYSQHPDNNLGDAVYITADGTGSIEGTITHGNKLIEAADVFCWAVLPHMILTQSTTTGADGVYKLDNLEAGDYFVVASAKGYQTAFYGAGTSPMDADMVRVADGESTGGIDIQLSRARSGSGAISGTVSGEAPIPGAWIMVMGRPRFFDTSHAFAISDENGHYLISNLEAGSYLVAAYANGYIPELYVDDSGTIPTYVEVTNAEVPNINFVLEKGGSIAGHVQGDQNEPLANVKLTARSRNAMYETIPRLGSLVQIAFTDEEGNYQIEGLADGDYTVSACLCDVDRAVKYWDDKDNARDSDIITVAQAAAITGIDFNFAVPSAKISGVISDAQNNPLKNIYITYAFERDDDNRTIHRSWQKFFTDENGYYEIDHLAAGTYFVSAWQWDRMNFSGIWYENSPTLEGATPIELADGAVRDDIDITLDVTSSYGSISGRVTREESGDAVEFACVKAIPVKIWPNSDAFRHQPTMYAFTDAEGNYTITPLYRGEYKVVLRTDTYKEYYNDKQEFANADIVTVAGGEETPDIDFAIPATSTEGSHVTGIVTDESTEEPIAGALVTVFPARTHRWFDGNMIKWGRVFYSTFTDEQGAYDVAGIPEGSYIVAAWARDFIAEFYDDVRTPFRATLLELDGLTTQSGIDFALQPRRGPRFAQHPGAGRYGCIAGRVRSFDGQPIDGAFIYAVDGEDNMIACEISNEDGSYALDGLQEGDYTVMASRALYETTFYPNVTEMAGATVLAIDAEEDMEHTDVTIVMHTEEITATEHEISAAAEFSLAQNYPNPFNPSTVIAYRIPQAMHVELQVFNVQGQLVKTLVSQFQAGGAYQVVWDGKDMNGALVPTGVYFYQIQANDYNDIRRLVFMR